MSCPRCPHCIASGVFGSIDPSDPALITNQPRAVRLHKSQNATFGVCGAYAFRYADRRSGSGVEDWKDVTCPHCLNEQLGKPS